MQAQFSNQLRLAEGADELGVAALYALDVIHPVAEHHADSIEPRMQLLRYVVSVV